MDRIASRGLRVGDAPGADSETTRSGASADQAAAPPTPPAKARVS
jgi:hypothetical protein